MRMHDMNIYETLKKGSNSWFEPFLFV